MAKVSVIVPSYRRPDLLRNTMLSVSRQSFLDWELIVVDDNGKGSPFQLETCSVMQPFLGDSRISYLVLEQNIGGSAARNRGWRRAAGDFICFLDNDDEFLPQKLEHQLQILESGEYQATVCRFESVKNGVVVSTSPLIPMQMDFLIPFCKGEINLASGSTMMVRKSLLEKLGGFDEDFGRKQDVELMIRLLAVTVLHVDERILVKLHIDDRTNIPSLEKFVHFQELFMEKFQRLFSNFSRQDQKKIAAYNQIELAKVALWNRNWAAFTQSFFSSRISWGMKAALLKDLFRKFITYYVK